MVTINDAQVAQLQQMVGTLAADQALSDAASGTLATALTAQAAADAAVGTARAAVATASQAVSADLTALQAFVDGLAAPAPPAGGP